MTPSDKATPGDVSATATGLARQLIDEPFRFDFFQAVRVLQKLLPQRRPVGHDFSPSDESVRFRAWLSLAFPASEVYDLVRPDGADRPWDMTVTFLGLTGPSGALPRPYTELLLDRSRFKDRTLRDFLDLFNHRLTSLFYRAWEKNRFWIGYERAEVEARKKRVIGGDHYRRFVVDERPNHDLFSECLLSLTGLGQSELRYRASGRDRLHPRTSLDDETFRFYSGLFSCQHRNASALESMLQDYFDLPIEVVQLCGQWLQLELENQSCLVDDGNVTLGSNAVVGERFWDLQGKFTLRLGPLTYAQFLRFLPPGEMARPLVDFVQLYAGRTFDVDARLVLQAAEVPACRLSGAEGGSHLGWDMWIYSVPPQADVEDAVFLLVDSEGDAAVLSA